MALITYIYVLQSFEIYLSHAFNLKGKVQKTGVKNILAKYKYKLFESLFYRNLLSFFFDPLLEKKYDRYKIIPITMAMINQTNAAFCFLSVFSDSAILNFYSVPFLSKWFRLNVAKIKFIPCQSSTFARLRKIFWSREWNYLITRNETIMKLKRFWCTTPRPETELCFQNMSMPISGFPFVKHPCGVCREGIGHNSIYSQ